MNCLEVYYTDIHDIKVTDPFPIGRDKKNCSRQNECIWGI